MATALPRNLATDEVIDEVWTDAVTNSFVNMPWGHLARVTRVTDQAGIGTGASDITGMSVTVTTPIARLLRVTVQLMALPPTAGALVIYLMNSDNSVIYQQCNIPPSPSGGAAMASFVAMFATTANTAHMFKLRASTGAGTATAMGNANYPMLIEVEDIGPVIPL